MTKSSYKGYPPCPLDILHGLTTKEMDGGIHDPRNLAKWIKYAEKVALLDNDCNETRRTLFMKVVNSDS